MEQRARGAEMAQLRTAREPHTAGRGIDTHEGRESSTLIIVIISTSAHGRHGHGTHEGSGKRERLEGVGTVAPHLATRHVQGQGLECGLAREMQDRRAIACRELAQARVRGDPQGIGKVGMRRGLRHDGRYG